MTPALPEPKLPHKNPGVEKPDRFFVKKSCIIRKSDNPHFGALLVYTHQQSKHDTPTVSPLSYKLKTFIFPAKIKSISIKVISLKDKSCSKGNSLCGRNIIP